MLRDSLLAMRPVKIAHILWISHVMCTDQESTRNFTTNWYGFL